MLRIMLLIPLLCLAVPGLATAQKTLTQPRSVADIVADLKKGDAEKTRAFQELEALGPKAAEAIPALMQLMPTKDEFVRLQAVIVLGKIGQPSVEPLTKLIQSSSDADLRFYGVWGLAFVGPAAKRAAPSVVAALADSSVQVKRKAAYALGRIDADPALAVNPLVAALGEADETVRAAAAEAIPAFGKAAVPALKSALKSDKAALRNTAIKALGDIGAAASDAVPELKALLLAPDTAASAQAADSLARIGAGSLAALTDAASSDSDRVRGLALQSLQRIGAAAVPTLVDLLGSKYLDVRRQSAAVLGGMQVNDKMVVIGLGYALRDKDFQVRQNAIQSIRQMGTAAKLAEPYVSELLVDNDPQMRMLGFQTLQNLGVDPRPGLKKALSNKSVSVRINTASLMAELNLETDLAEPILLAGIKEKNLALRTQAAYALSIRGLQPDVVLPIFIEGLGDKDASVRRQAAQSIARYGDKAAKASKLLIAALDDSDDAVRAQALQTLRVVEKDAKVMFPAMIKILKQRDGGLHAVAAQTVFQVGPDAIGQIVDLLKKEDAPALRLVCLQTLAMAGPPAKDAVPELIKALDDKEARVRMTAARALSNVGPAAKDALPALTKLEKDDDANVRQIAKAALVQIKGDANQKGFQVQGVLTPGDPFDRVRGNCFHVVHTYPMKAGQRYTINLNSPWDNYLRLENALGAQLAADDDSGGALNARIIFQAPQDGWYRIIVTTFAPGASGNYTLRVD